METEFTRDHLTEVERQLKEKFKRDDPRFLAPSNAGAPAQAERIDQLALPLNERPPMPLTKDKYLVREHPQKVAWEREVRRFLHKLSGETGHRISAPMIYEWTTGIRIAELVQRVTQNGTKNSASPDLRKINEILRFYFGKPYSTWIAGRKVPNCYRVKPGFDVRYRRPMTLTLYAEYVGGTLEP